MSASRFDPETQSFVFCHVPKCGGTTMHAFLEEVMQGHYVHCAPGNDWQERVPTAWGAGGHQVNGQNPLSQRRNKEIIRLVVLRDPLDRFLSFWRHIQDHPNHYLAQRPGVREMSPSQFAEYAVAEKLYEFHNLQSKYVVGPRRDFKDLATVLRAFRDEFRFCAPVEHLEHLFRQLNAFFGRSVNVPERRNVSTPAALSPAEIRKTGRIVYNHNFNDLQLYLECTRRFASDLSNELERARSSAL